MPASGTLEKSGTLRRYGSFTPQSGLTGQNHLLSVIAQTPHSALEGLSGWRLVRHHRLG